MPDQPMELGIAEGILAEMSEERWEALLAGDAEPTLEEIHAFRAIWKEHRQLQTAVGKSGRSGFRRSLKASSG
jgi:hypothetical protein